MALRTLHYLALYNLKWSKTEKDQNIYINYNKIYNIYIYINIIKNYNRI